MLLQNLETMYSGFKRKRFWVVWPGRPCKYLVKKDWSSSLMNSGASLVFLFFNDISTSITHSYLNLIADDSSLVATLKNRDNLEQKIFIDSRLLRQWLWVNFLCLNTYKTELIVIRSFLKRNLYNIMLGDIRKIWPF